MLDNELKMVFEDLMYIISENSDIDMKDQHFAKTPERVAKSYLEILEAQFEDWCEVSENILEDGKFKAPSNCPKVVVSDIRAYSLCSHHLLPVSYLITVEYTPSNYMVGISKIPRVVQYLAKRLVTQEQYTNDIIEVFKTVLNPKFVAVYLQAEHYHISMRGVKENAVTMTEQYYENSGTDKDPTIPYTGSNGTTKREL